MGIVFQQSCFLVPDAKFRAIDPGRIRKGRKQGLVKRRRRKLYGIVEEARAWMYAILLPTDIIANGDESIKRGLDQQIAKLTTKLLGSKIDHNKVNAVCGKIARNILVRGIANIEPGSQYYPNHPPEPTFDQMEHLLDTRFIRAGFLEFIYKRCDGFEREHPHARTWYEIRQVAGPYTIYGKPLLDLLKTWQEHMTRAELGLPYYQNWRNEAESAIYARIRSRDPNVLTDFTPAERDLILVRAGGEQADQDVIAESNKVTNIMTLHHGFYERPAPDSLRGIQMRDNKDSLHWISTGVTALLHELTHSKDVLYSDDHEFAYFNPPHEWAIDYILPMHLHNLSNSVARFAAYGLESCLALVRRDEIENFNKAEDNAESWALYFTLRVLLLAYPELDIVGALETHDPMALHGRLVTDRDELLHHCTLFLPLRHPECNDFPRRRLDYDESKDWCKQERNWAPRTVKDLLTVLQILLEPGTVRSATQMDDTAWT